MSFPLFKQTMKSNWLLLVFITLMLIMYLVIFIGMYDPDGMDGIGVMMDMMPEALINALGFNADFLTITGYLAGYFFGFLTIVFPMIFTIITANKLIAKDVDSGSMAYLLVSPMSRLRIVLTRAVFLPLSIFTMFAVVFIVGISTSESYLPGALDIGVFFKLNLCAMLFSIAVGGISFFFSCIAKDTKRSLMFGAGIPILFFFILMISDIGPDLAWLKSFTIFSLLDSERVLAEDGFTLISCLVSGAISLATYIGGILIFNKRDLSV